jgi:hypothetical protein
MPRDISLTPFELGFDQEPFCAVGEQRTGVPPSLEFPIETLKFLRKTTLRVLLTSSRRMATARCSTRIADIARQIPWPRGFTARIRRNAFTERWHGREDALEAAVAVEAPRYRQAFEAGDPEHTGVWFGEACGVIRSIEPAALIVERMVVEAAERIRSHKGATLPG